MKGILALIVTLFCITASDAERLECSVKKIKAPTDWIDMVPPCISVLEDQVKEEVDAALTYLAMGIHFAQDTVNRPGFSKFFLDSANEEREHAIKVMEYLLMRGQLTSGTSNLLNFPLKPGRQEWPSGLEALKDALKKEIHVTKRIQKILRDCESPKDYNVNDYHLVDYFTADFLDEQYKGQRALAGKISTLGKMIATYDTLGEILFDQKMIKGEF